MPRVRLHGLEDVVGLVGHGLAGSAHETGPVGATGDARDEAAGGGAPPGRAETREGRHHVATARVWHRRGDGGRVTGMLDEAQAVAQPLDD